MPSMGFFSSQRENAISALLTFSITNRNRKGWDIPVPLGHLDVSRCPLARISHRPSTAAAQWHALTGVRLVGMLDIVSATPARPSVTTASQGVPLNHLATNAGEKSGLATASRRSDFCVHAPFRSWRGARSVLEPLPQQRATPPRGFSARAITPMFGGTYSSRMLKKSFHGLFQRRNRKMRFPGSFIFNNLQSSKMEVHPCTAHRPLKNAIFQWPANVHETP